MELFFCSFLLNTPTLNLKLNTPIVTKVRNSALDFHTHTIIIPIGCGAPK